MNGYTIDISHGNYWLVGHGNVVLILQHEPAKIEFLTVIHDTTNVAALHNALICGATRFAEITGLTDVPYARIQARVAFDIERFEEQLRHVTGGRKHLVELNTSPIVVHCTDGADAE